MEFVHLVILAFVVPWGNLGTASGYYERPRKPPKFWDVATLNSNSVLRDGMSKPDTAYFAIYRTTSSGPYFGATATFDVQGFPNFKDTEVSSGKLWIQNRDNKDERTLNSLQAGWRNFVRSTPKHMATVKHISLFTGRTTPTQADRGKTTGCHDLECTGFVPVNGAPITPGDTLEPANGQKKISVKIFKSKDDGDWWLHYGSDINNLRPVGYWPKSILTNMQDHASDIAWGEMANGLQKLQHLFRIFNM
ncbi:hypothetical protein EJB05_34960 [Eragrostis curvula]|uniref:Neprosin PEP catalytic domain-containing protein n=1 Tax=Eragrostis curvula TaxID=38414 RepID=A0A5J9U5J0_9POAL|nr:hypothetical protein EJB05_34960 [Eragrostis curvula]